MKTIFRFRKKADASLNRILLPKIIIDKYGREFFIDIMEDESIRLVPVTKENENKE